MSDNKCVFNLAYIGPCNKPCKDEFCEEHIGLKCKDCVNQADHQCEHASSLVCGRDLCKDHAFCKYHDEIVYKRGNDVFSRTGCVYEVQ